MLNHTQNGVPVTRTNPYVNGLQPPHSVVKAEEVTHAMMGCDDPSEQ